MRSPESRTPPAPVSKAECRVLTTPAPEDVSFAASLAIRTPLAALRASMESLVHGLDGSDPRATTLRGALDEVVRLGRSVQALIDYALPSPVRPLSCSLGEVVRAAVDGIDGERRARVISAVEGPGSRLLVDGPLLSRCLVHWISAALESSSEPVLLRARMEPNEAVLTLLHPAPRGRSGSDGASCHETGVHALGLAMACREIARLGGTLSVTETPGMQTVSEIHITLAPAREERA